MREKKQTKDADLRVTRHQEDGQSSTDWIKWRRLLSVTVVIRCWLLY